MFTEDQINAFNALENEKELRNTKETIDALEAKVTWLISRDRALFSEVSDFFFEKAAEQSDPDKFSVPLSEVNGLLERLGLNPVHIEKKHFVRVTGEFTYLTEVVASTQQDAVDIVTDQLAFQEFDDGEMRALPISIEVSGEPL